MPKTKKPKYIVPNRCPVCKERGTIYYLNRAYERHMHTDEKPSDIVTCIHSTHDVNHDTATQEAIAHCTRNCATGQNDSLYLTWYEAMVDGRTCIEEASLNLLRCDGGCDIDVLP